MKDYLTVLLLDTNKEVLSYLEGALKTEGYTVIMSSSSKEALEIAKNKLPHLIILELLMPDMDGIDLCSEIREVDNLSDTLIVFYTEKNDDFAQVAALNAGADDYIIKPVKARVLLIRLNALLKRHKANQKKLDAKENEGLTISRDEYMVYKDGKKIVLPRKEFELLALLLKTPGKIITRKYISNEIWGHELEPRNRTIDVHIRMIRKKVGITNIKTVKGVGYIFNPQ